MYKKSLLIILLIVSLSGCGDILDVDDPGSEIGLIHIPYVEPGAFLDNKQIIEVEIADALLNIGGAVLDIKIYDARGGLLGEEQKTLGQDISEFFLYLEDLDLPEGYYKILFTLLENSTESARQELDFFLTEKKLALEGIESSPSVVFPGVQVRLNAVLDIPGEIDPYLLWKVNNEILFRGKYSELGSYIDITASEEDGVYPVSLELFPVPPPEDYSFLSPLRMDVALYVTKSKKPSHRDFFPGSSYYLLFHFAGDEVNVSREISGVTAQSVGEPVLVYTRGDLGYKLMGGSGFFIPRPLFPGTKLAPVTINLGLEMLKESNNRTLLITESMEPGFRLALNNDSRLQGVFTLDDEEYVLNSEIFLVPSKGRQMVSLSLLPEENGLRAFWFLEGKSAGESFVEEFPLDFSTSEGGRVVIGGPEGPDFIIDEFGVYHKDLSGKESVDPGIFTYVVKQANPDVFRDALGFEGTEIPERVKVSGEVTPVPGYLEISPGAEVRIPLTASVSLDFRLTGISPDGADGEVSLRFSGGETLAGILDKPVEFKLTPGKIVFPSGASLEAPKEYSEFELVISNKGSKPLLFDDYAVLKVIE